MRLKRVISAALAVSMAVSMMPATAVSAFAEETSTNTAETTTVTGKDSAESKAETSGSCGKTKADKLEWSFNESTGVLTISGAGDMADYSSQTGVAPWKVFANKITEIQIGEQVTGIGTEAFNSLENLKKVNIPASIKRFGSYIFNNDKNLVTVDWASGFKAPSVQDTDELMYNNLTYEGTYVPTGMFDHCSKLGDGKELTDWLPSSFTGICCAAFRGTKFTVDFDQLKDMKYWGPYAFASMDNLDSVTLTENGLILGKLNGGATTFEGSGLKKMVVNTKVVPAWIADNCPNLKTVELGNEVTTIETGAFGNTGITELNVPKTANEITIESAAFVNNKNLKSVTLHGNVMLKGAAFAGCGIENFTVAEDAKVLGTSSPFSAWENNRETIATAVTTVKDVKIMGTLEATEVSGETHVNQTIWLWNHMFPDNTGIKEVTVNGANLQYIVGSTFPSLKKMYVVDGNATTGYELNYANSQLENIVIDVDEFASQCGAFRDLKQLKTISIKANTAKLGGLDFTLCPELEVVDLSQCEKVQYNSTDANQDCFGSNASDLPSDVKIYVNNEEADPHTHDYGINQNYGTVFVVNGGTVGADNTVTKAGYTFDGWYEKADFTGKAVTTPEIGKTYYAKWKVIPVAATMDVTTSKSDYLVNTPVDVNIAIAPGTDMYKILNGSVALTYGDEVEKVELNGKELTEKEYTVQELARMMKLTSRSSDIKATLNVTYKKAGKFDFGVALKDANGDQICDAGTPVVVAEEAAELTPATKLYTLTVKNADVTIKNGDEEIKAEKNDKGELIAKVPEKADVTVTYTSQSDAVAFDQWTITTDETLDVDVKNNPLKFQMPAGGVTIEAMTKDASIEEDEPNILGTAAVVGTATVGTAILAWQGYQLGTELYLKTALPACTAIPTNRAELALLVWNHAGKPAPAAVLPADATDTQKAIAWAVENDLLKAAKDNGETYVDTDSVSRVEVIRVWNKAQEK